MLVKDLLVAGIIDGLPVAIHKDVIELLVDDKTRHVFTLHLVKHHRILPGNNKGVVAQVDLIGGWVIGHHFDIICAHLVDF